MLVLNFCHIHSHPPVSDKSNAFTSNSLSLNSQMSKLPLVTSRTINNAARGRSYPQDSEELRDLKNVSISTQI